ncbi:helix-turn-helix transcriptional regulator [Lichenifustis flavocetrariae]|uniref:AlpA family phage regulatory protein n=1 Tax=Lichenifustis flavocetrariae TaxID=2949735 RepID=A0AA41YY41_9HYPH|nr:AlpA family phage regulatory protein [Lichenifustis flavocetrariae]MCW6506970.1 AlpA family phage regulatory protein [Lichenifustis flavocetrariae]
MRYQTALPTFLDRHRMLNTKQSAEMLGFSVAHFRRLYRNGRVPKPQQIGGRKYGWPAGVIIDLTSKVEAA